ncbi:HAMP domain-containing histidine kinase, partial [candidate division KSB1 bacterium]|nr:HAMP domain-containing histidine kinase [candidate division KSB1 bacterium]
IVIWAPLYFYMDSAIQKMHQETANILKFYANIHKRAATDKNELSPLFLKYVFDEIILRTDIPIINTDKHKNPQYWEGIEIDPDDKSPAAVEKVRQIIRSLEGKIEPIALTYSDPVSGQEIMLGYLYYGESDLITHLRYLPYIEIAIVNVLILIGLLGSYFVFKGIKKTEERSIWVGMAKETAHQLGTPLSSLMGWLEIIKSNERECELTRNTIAEMEKDVKRLYKVVDRFSQIGSKADLALQDVGPILHDVVLYIQRRLPHVRKKVEIIEDYAAVPKVPLNRALFEWVIENLLKNSIDAIKSENGKIQIKVRALHNNQRKIYVDIRDNGIGIQGMNKNIIFKPGYSTKKRGWGLGLNLAKRIVEESHGGKLFIKETRVGEGTTMRITL